jgi:hypothetical protein
VSAAAKIVSADDACPLCAAPMPQPAREDYRLAGTWDGSLGLGFGRGPFGASCAACGARLIGWQYTTYEEDTHGPVCRVRWDGKQAAPGAAPK